MSHYTEQGADQNTEIGNIENDPIKGLKGRIKGKIIYHIFAFQAVIGVGKGST